MERNRLIDAARRVVVKVGSAVLTTSTGLNTAVVEDLAAQVSDLHDRGLDVVLVSSGAVAAGRGVLRSALELCEMPQRQAASAVGQSRLMHAYDQAFGSRGKITAQILLTRDDLQSRRRFLNARNTFHSLLAWRVVPIVNENDTVAVQELVFGDNDSLASQLLNLVEADLFINLTSAKGVFSANPDEHADARPLSCIEDVGALDVDALCGGKTSVGTGGMNSKLRSAQRAAQLGVPTLIVSGREPGSLRRVFDGEELGTLVLPEPKKVSSRKFWLAYHADPAGSVTVDQGAVRALVERDKSLLPAGIREVDGHFGRGAIIRIKDEQGGSLGVGLTNYSAADLRRVRGKKSAEIEALLGYCYPDAVNRDNLLLDAAV